MRGLDVVMEAIDGRESRADRLIDIHDRGIVVPAVRVEAEREVLLHLIGTVLLEQRHHTRASRPTGHPKNERIGLGLVSRLKQPIEDVAVCLMSMID